MLKTKSSHHVKLELNQRDQILLYQRPDAQTGHLILTFSTALRVPERSTETLIQQILNVHSYKVDLFQSLRFQQLLKDMLEYFKTDLEQLNPPQDFSLK